MSPRLMLWAAAVPLNCLLMGYTPAQCPDRGIAIPAQTYASVAVPLDIPPESPASVVLLLQDVIFPPAVRGLRLYLNAPRARPSGVKSPHYLGTFVPDREGQSESPTKASFIVDLHPVLMRLGISGSPQITLTVEPILRRHAGSDSGCVVIGALTVVGR